MLAMMGMQAEGASSLNLTGTWVGWVGAAVFVIAYVLVALESRTHMRKSKPVILAAGIIWMLAASAYAARGDLTTAGAALRENIGDYGQLFLFILAAMTFVNTMEERQLFDALRSWLAQRQLSLRTVFWITGIISFFLSSQIDNMTTALVMGTVVLTVGRGQPRFQAVACINVVIAANAGGAWSPFGDITSLMVWQAGILPFFRFYRLFVPALVNWLVPAAIMSLGIGRAVPHDEGGERVRPRRGAWVVVALFAFTVLTAVSSYQLLGLPPALGMMTGLGLLNMYGYYLRQRGVLEHTSSVGPLAMTDVAPSGGVRFDVFHMLQRAEWDTLMFFYGVIVAVGGLDFMGLLARLSQLLYVDLGPTLANTGVGVISGVVDNIPVMFSVIAMHPAVSGSQWLLVTMTAGVGGSLLSIGSAAGVALMGQSRGVYTFVSHLRWTWAIALGYAASIVVHLWLNGG